MCDGFDGQEGLGPQWQTDPDCGSGGGKSRGHTYYDSEYPYERDYPEPNYPEPPPDYYENRDYPEPDYPDW
jgi:hypothetical protein